MNLAQICSYLNEVGILDINNIKNYLTMTTNIVNNDNNRSNNDIYKISLFAYLRGINNNDKNLYFLCTNIINSYNRYILIKKYNYLHHFKKIIYYKIFQRFNYFTISLFRNFPFKAYHTNRYHNNKNNVTHNNTSTNRFYKKNNTIQNVMEINKKDNNSQFQTNKLISKKDSGNKTNHTKIDSNKDIKKEKNNIYLKSDINDICWSYYRELDPVKKCKKINMYSCINQSNINFEKFFINKKLVMCRKYYPSLIEDIKSNRKYLYIQNKPSLRKNKSETKLRMKKMIYEENTRKINFENIKPELKRKIKKRAQSNKKDALYDKEKEDKLYNKIIGKVVDKKNIIDRLYTVDLIKKKKEERKQKDEELSKNKKTPKDWDQIYLQTNEKIINNKKNFHKRNKTCSYFKPNKGRIYLYEENDNNNDININSNTNHQNNKNIENNNNKMKKKQKIKNGINNNKDNNFINSDKFIINKCIDTDNINKEKEKDKEYEHEKIYEIKNDLNKSINNEKEENKKKSKIIDYTEEKQVKEKEVNNSLEESINSNEEDLIKKNKDKYDISLAGFKSKGLQELLKKDNANNKDKNNNINNNEDSKEKNKKEDFPKIGDKMNFNDLLYHSNNSENDEDK